jgi:glycosyltransferase involved in cell wall biosynthesis
MNKPKLLIISTATAIGGGEVYLANLLPLINKNYDLTVLATPTVRQLLGDSVKTEPLKLFPTWLEKSLSRSHRLKKIYYSAYFRRFFAGKSFDLVSFQGFEGAIVEAIPIRPLVLTLHTRFPIPRQFDNYIVKVFDAVDKVICVSQQARQDLLERGVPDSKCETVYNGISVSAYPYLEKTGSHITWIGRVEEEDKNPLLFVKIAELAQSQNLDYKFRIVGRGSYLGELKAYIAEHKVKNIDLTGFIEPSGMARIYADSSLLCMTSTSEGLPYVALEAMAQGIPVVSTAVGGLRELIPDSSCGVLVDKADDEEFLAKIDELINDPKRYESIRKAARTRIEKNFTSEAMARNTEAIYNQLLGAKS